MRRLLPLLIVSVLAGCGGDSKSEGTATAADGKVSVTAREYSFKRGTIVAPSGKLEIALANDGSIPHDFRIKDKPGGTPPTKGGDDSAATYDLEPGTYTFYCSIGDHEQLGMKGKLRVEE